MQRCLAIAFLTWKAAFRFRLFWVLAALLLMSVVLLPLFIKDDGQRAASRRYLLTYTLSVITALLGLATLWLACGIPGEGHRGMPIADGRGESRSPRWQIWLGKWLGLVFLNLALLALAGASVYGLLHYRASRLPAREQEILRREIMVARGSLKPPKPDLEAEVERVLQQRLRQNPVPAAELPAVRKQFTELVQAARQVALPGYPKDWVVDVGLAQGIAARPTDVRAGQILCSADQRERLLPYTLANWAAGSCGAQRSAPGAGCAVRIRDPSESV
jgi:hypothetical protein